MLLSNETNPNYKQPERIFSFPEPDILSLTCQEEEIMATLSDGRVVSIPKAWYKPFREATTAQLKDYQVLPQKKGVYFPLLDEYLSVKSFTHGLNSACC